MLDLMQSFYAYNSWATAQLLDSLEKLSPEELTAPDCSGHGSIRDTLAHLMTTQWGWLSWFDGSLDVNQAYALKVPSESIDTVAKARDRWKSIDKQATDFVDTLSEEKLSDIWSWSLATGHSDSLPLSRLLLHLANHGTHTRAQILAGIRRAGHEPPNIDFLNYSLSVR